MTLTKPRRRPDLHSAEHKAKRRAVNEALAAGHTFTCWKCGRALRYGDETVIGHKVPVSRGGDVNDTAVECRRCSDSERGLLGQETHRQRTQQDRRWY